MGVGWGGGGIEGKWTRGIKHQDASDSILWTSRVISFLRVIPSCTAERKCSLMNALIWLHYPQEGCGCIYLHPQGADTLPFSSKPVTVQFEAAARTLEQFFLHPLSVQFLIVAYYF